MSALDPVFIQIGDKQALIDAEDLELVQQYKWRLLPRRYTCYAITNIRRGRGWTAILMHNLILENKGIDHINGDGLDNRKSNLRISTQHQNNGNYKKRKGKSKYKGVCPTGPGLSTWKASIRHGQEKIYLGSFKTEEEAAKAYDKAALEYFKEFACINFPDGH